MGYIVAGYDWSTGDTITAARLDSNVSNFVDGLSDGTKDLNVSSVLIGGTTTLNSSRELSITKLTVDSIVVDGGIISTTSGNMELNPVAGSAVKIDSIWSFDGNTLQGLTAVNLTMLATAGQNISIESVTFDGGVVAGITTATITTANITTADFGTNTISDGAMSGNWDFGTGNITTGGIIKIDVDGTAENAAGSLTIGAGNDAGIFFDGTDLIIITNGVGASGIRLNAEDDTVEIYGSDVLQATFDTSGLNLVSGDAYYINATSVLNATTLGAGVTASSLTTVGTLTTLTVDNITINGSDISHATAASLTITATAGQNVSIEGVTFDGGVVAGASSITSTAFVGTLSTAAQPNITSLGTLTGLTINSATITLSQDTNFVLSGGINGVSFDTTTLSIDGSGHRVGINNAAPTVLLEISSSGSVISQISAFSADTTGARLAISKSRHATINSHTIVVSGDELGGVYFYGSNGTTFDTAAAITASSDGTPGASADMPGRLGFWTSADASATLTERLRITSDGRIYGTALHNNAGSVTGTTTQYIASGTYTPTLTLTTNVSVADPQVCQWMRVGNVVTVSGDVDIALTTTLLASELGMSLPIASDFATTFQLGGIAEGVSGTQGNNQSMTIRINGDITNNRAKFSWANQTETSGSGYSFIFTYLIV